MPRLNSLIITLFILLSGIATVSAQTPRLPPTITQTQGTGSVPVTNGDDAQKQQAIAANEQRQVEIRRDTEKMAELTQELKEYLEKTDQGVMSLDAIKKAEQIEKLAHSVKSKMKQSF
jgi:TolA-binding protein